MSLYLPWPAAQAIDAVRQSVDPVQFRLIPAHVTLCREDELDGIDASVLQRRFADMVPAALSLWFGAPEPFHGHGILLPCVAGGEDFQALRRWVLNSPRVRHHPAHITLAHPRNPKAHLNHGPGAVRLESPLRIQFDKVMRIVQQPNEPWRVLEAYPLAQASPAGR